MGAFCKSFTRIHPKRIGGIARRRAGYPSRPVRIIVPFAAGGPADIYARFVGQRLQEALGQPFVIRTGPAAARCSAPTPVAKSAPDGYTLLMMSIRTRSTKSLISNKPFQLLRDFAPVSPVNYSDLVLVPAPLVQAKHAGKNSLRSPSEPHALNYACRRAPARPITWRANCSRRWRAWTSCTSPTRAVRVRAPMSSAGRCR